MQACLVLARFFTPSVWRVAKTETAFHERLVRIFPAFRRIIAAEYFQANLQQLDSLAIIGSIRFQLLFHQYEFQVS